MVGKQPLRSKRIPSAANKQPPIIKGRPLLVQAPLEANALKQQPKAAAFASPYEIKPQGVRNVQKEKFDDYLEKLRRIRMQNYNNRKLSPYIKINGPPSRNRFTPRGAAKNAAVNVNNNYNLQKPKEPQPVIQPNKITVFNITKALNAIDIEAISKEAPKVSENLPSNRQSWQEGTSLNSLEVKSLATSDKIEIIPKSPRKGWDQPHQTILKALERADISSDDESDSERVDSPVKLKTGVTFRITDLPKKLETEADTKHSSVFEPKASKKLLIEMTTGWL